MRVAHAQFYKFEDARHKAVATTTGPDGKSARRIRYELDDAGGFSSGPIFGLDCQLRSRVWKKMTRCSTRSFTTTIQRESRSAIFDASGKLIERHRRRYPVLLFHRKGRK
jgi:hypothetical protein